MFHSHGCPSVLRKPCVELVRGDKGYDKPDLPSSPEGTQSLLFDTLATGLELPGLLKKHWPLQESGPGRARQDMPFGPCCL